MVSKTIDDFPEPETPVKMVNFRFGMRTETFWRPPCLLPLVDSSSSTLSLGAGRGQALAGAAFRRRQKKYERPQSTPVPAAQPQLSGPSPTDRWAMSAEPRLMAKPA